MRILLLEDNVDVRDLYCNILTRLGATVIPAASCAMALAALDLEPFDKFMLDYHLPDGTGVDVLHAIRGRGWDTEVIFITSDSGNPELLKQAKGKGTFIVDKAEYVGSLVECVKG